MHHEESLHNPPPSRPSPRLPPPSSAFAFHPLVAAVSPPLAPVVESVRNTAPESHLRTMWNLPPNQAWEMLSWGSDRGSQLTATGEINNQHLSAISIWLSVTVGWMSSWITMMQKNEQLHQLVVTNTLSWRTIVHSNPGPLLQRDSDYGTVLNIILKTMYRP